MLRGLLRATRTATFQVWREAAAEKAYRRKVRGQQQATSTWHQRRGVVLACLV